MLQTREEHRCFGGTIGFYQHASTETRTPMNFGVFVPPQALSAVPELQVLPTQQPAQVWAQPWVGAAHAASTQLSPVEQAWQALPPAPQALDSVPGLQVPS